MSGTRTHWSMRYVWGVTPGPASFASVGALDIWQEGLPGAEQVRLHDREACQTIHIPRRYLLAALDAEESARAQGRHATPEEIVESWMRAG